MSLKTICFLAPSLSMGGIERSMTILANYFVNKDYSVHYISIFPFEHFFQLDERVKFYEPNFVHKYKANALTRLYYYLKVFMPVRGFVSRIVNMIQPDLIISFGDWFPHLAMLALHGKYPFYYCNRSNPAIRYAWPFELVRNLAYRFYPPVGIIAQTQRAKERKEIILGEKIKNIKICVIPNPVRKIYSDGVARENFIISVGRMYWSKGFGRVLDVFVRLKAAGWNLVLVGDGEELSEIKQKVRDLGVESRVIFTGSVTNVDEWLLRSKIYLMGSYMEGFPNTLCEAMAAGCACVSYDIIAGPSDIIENNVNGILVTDGDVDEMVAKTQYLIDCPEEIKRLGEQAKLISDNLSLEKICGMYYDFIQS